MCVGKVQPPKLSSLLRFGSQLCSIPIPLSEEAPRKKLQHGGAEEPEERRSGLQPNSGSATRVKSSFRCLFSSVLEVWFIVGPHHARAACVPDGFNRT